MRQKLLITGGVANAVFFLFHAWLGWNIHHWTQLPPAVRGLVEMFNLGGALFIGFFAYASLRLRVDMLTTRLGRTVSFWVVLIYGTRAAGEFIFTPAVQPLILTTCVAMAAIYLAVLAIPERVAASAVASA